MTSSAMPARSTCVRTISLRSMLAIAVSTSRLRSTRSSTRSVRSMVSRTAPTSRSRSTRCSTSAVTSMRSRTGSTHRRHQHVEGLAADDGEVLPRREAHLPAARGEPLRDLGRGPGLGHERRTAEHAEQTPGERRHGPGHDDAGRDDGAGHGDRGPDRDVERPFDRGRELRSASTHHGDHGAPVVGRARCAVVRSGHRHIFTYAAAPHAPHACSGLDRELDDDHSPCSRLSGRRSTSHRTRGRSHRPVTTPPAPAAPRTTPRVNNDRKRAQNRRTGCAHWE